MADLDFNVSSGATIKRDLMVVYLNTGTSSTAVWSPIGVRVESSSASYDWGIEEKKDIIGNTFVTAKSPTITETFEPNELVGGDAAQEHIWNIAIKDQDQTAVVNQDMLIAHFYANVGEPQQGEPQGVFAERYSACRVTPTEIGGDGGGTIGMSLEVTFAGTRTTGTVTKGTGGTITFTPD